MADKPPIGAGILGAYARQGAAEFRAIFYAESPIAQPTDYGMPLMAIPSEAAEARRGEEWGHEHEKDIGLDGRQAGASRDERDDPEIER
jgi:hypothetical protein